MIPSREAWMAALRERHGAALHERLHSACVAVCGLGGLGSNIAIALARAGVGHLILVDHDRVDLSNLHRQQYKAVQVGQYKTEALRDNLLEISPYTGITAVTARLSTENLAHLLQGAQVVCEALDDAESKAMLVDGVLEQLPDARVVAASGMAGLGSPNTIQTRRITGRFYLCGDGESDVADTIGLVAPLVMLCAAHQAQTVLRILAGQNEV